jgi:1-aminocyclopropane-1-carboxylate deaminase/D-cysteine desulfhydrase-like pyridoxal-dependent ACC family enzyme
MAVFTAFVAVEGFLVFSVFFRVRARLCHVTVFLAVVTDLRAVVKSILEIRTRVMEIIGVSFAMVCAIPAVGSTAAGITVTRTMGVSGVTVVHLTRF